jgi:uncharacterized membrane protein YqjE
VTPVTGDTAVTEPDRSIGALLSDILGDLHVIVRGEVRLAKAEIREEIAKARRGVVLLVAGGLVLAASLGCGLLAAIYGLSMVWPPWAAALAVGGGTAVLGAALALSGRKHIASVELPPQKTTASVRENLQWAKSRMK